MIIAGAAQLPPLQLLYVMLVERLATCVYPPGQLWVAHTTCSAIAQTFGVPFAPHAWVVPQLPQ